MSGSGSLELDVLKLSTKGACLVLSAVILDFDSAVSSRGAYMAFEGFLL
jgi:hypothetical protein